MAKKLDKKPVFQPERKTKEQIEAEIAALKELKPKIRARSIFGDDHHAAIDAQLDVLEKRLSENAVFDQFGTDEDLDRSQSVFDAAMDARNWMDGQDVETPSVSWKGLVK
jgi:hypothetical protein